METQTISLTSWVSALNQTLTQLRSHNRAARISIVGVGQELRGDDAAGALVARALSTRLKSASLQIIDAGSAPENCTGSLRQFRPDLILFIDAADRIQPPGTIHWLDWRATDNFVSTHTLSPKMLAQYLIAELGCAIGIIGIQPESTAFGAPLSRRVHGAVIEIEEQLARVLR